MDRFVDKKFLNSNRIISKIIKIFLVPIVELTR